MSSKVLSERGTSWKPSTQPTAMPALSPVHPRSTWAKRGSSGLMMLVALLVSGFFLLIDGAFFAANLLKLPEGGWIPLLFGLVVFTIMTTWHRGTRAVAAKLAEGEESPDAFFAELKSGRIARVPGTAVFFTRTARRIPTLLLNHVAQMKALQETVVTLTVIFEETPRVAEPNRAEVQPMADGIWHVVVRFGFVEVPNLVTALMRAKELGCPVRLDDAVYFAARDDVVRGQNQSRLWPWQRMLFAFMYRNAVRASDRFDLPAERYLEVGRQVRL
jgi:KUP system potassium uptake protein